MKKPDEIKKDLIDCMEEAIAVGQTCDAQDLLDFSDKAYVCMATTRAYIQHLEAANAEKDKRIGELEAVKRERDALLADLCMLAIKRIPCDMCRNDHRNDPICKSHQGDCSECSLHCPCDGCFDFWEMELTGANFQWRGVCPENTEVKGNA